MSPTPPDFGKKVFFLNPPSVLGGVIPELANAEFEVYETRDHRKLTRYLATDALSLLFVNIDEGNDESVWRAWIQGLKSAEATAALAFGAITMLPDDEKRDAYLMTLGASCGFITVSSGAAKTTEILLKTLEANEARGRRRYVRAVCPPDSASFNCRLDETVHRGAIRDLSSVGMAVAFEADAPARPGTRLKDMQLNLRGIRLTLNGVVMGSAGGEEREQVKLIMFEPASIDEDRRGKLRGFVRKTLQASMDAALARL